MSQLDQILEKYATFEHDVGQFTAEYCSYWCSTCKEVCCKADYCQETLDSAFLSLIRHRYPTPEAFSADQGWLTKTGCALTVGRPPVCYEFLCKRILDSRSARLDRYALNVLSKLITHIGWRAAGRRHLVEIMDPSDLPAIKSDTIGPRLEEAREAFQVVKSILAHNPVSEDAAECLTRVARPPGGLHIRH
jgi:hypothetical protein